VETHPVEMKDGASVAGGILPDPPPLFRRVERLVRITRPHGAIARSTGARIAEVGAISANHRIGSVDVVCR
jgi:hypothetical protein